MSDDRRDRFPAQGKAEPRFDIDLKYGRQGELQIGDYLHWIAAGDGRVEVKTKRILDWYFYVETHCDKGSRGAYEPSGILVTTAEAWAINIGDSGISMICPTDLIRMMVDDPTSKDKAETNGSCPTRGKLINLMTLLFRYKQRQERASQPAPRQAPRPPANVTAESINWGFSGRE